MNKLNYTFKGDEIIFLTKEVTDSMVVRAIERFEKSRGVLPKKLIGTGVDGYLYTIQSEK